MNFCVVGLSYKEATIEIREKLALTKNEYSPLFRKLYKKFKLTQIVIISTCNRLEIYYIPSEEQDFANNDLIAEFINFKEVNDINLNTFFVYSQKLAYRHLFRVASSLEAMIVGENQILSQVKEALEVSRDNGFLSLQLDFVFQNAFNISKKIRSQTEISKQTVSISSTAVNLASSIFDTLHDKKVLVVGAGEMAELIVQHLKKIGVSRIFITNRTFKNSLKLAEEVQGSAIWYKDRYEQLLDVSIVITSTGAKGFVLDYAEVSKILNKKKKQSTFFIDIAIPRDIDPNIAEISNAYLYCLDDLQNVINQNTDFRNKESIKADTILEASLEKFMGLLKYRQKSNLIRPLQEQQKKTIEQELAIFFKKNPEQLKNKTSIERLIYKLNKKFLHHPYLFLRKNYTQGADLVFTDIFGLSDKNEINLPTSNKKIINIYKKINE